jgi:hypothetical protein
VNLCCPRQPARGDGPVATTARTGEECVISDVSTMKRSKLAKEFGIAKIHLVPVDGGVLEYGTPSQDYLRGQLMKASLKMRCDTSGAGYAIYWKEVRCLSDWLTLLTCLASPSARRRCDSATRLRVELGAPGRST